MIIINATNTGATTRHVYVTPPGDVALPTGTTEFMVSDGERDYARGQLDNFAGDVTYFEREEFPAQVRLSGFLAPAALAGGTTNDWSPGGLDEAGGLRVALSNTVGATLSGLAGGADGRMLVLLNNETSALKTLTLSHEGGGSAAGNRFHFAGGAAVVVPAGGITTLWYDGALSRWRAYSIVG